MLDIRNITVRFAGREILAEASAQLPDSARVGIVGRNGAGKTTLLRLLTGEISPDHGEIAVPARRRIGTVAQEAPGGPESVRDTVLAADPERLSLLAEAETARDPVRIAEIHQRLGDIDAETAPARAARILAGLGFDDEAQQRPCSAYSGGWRMRVALAAALFAEPDILLLDEPTNYLDLEGAMWLEGFLRRWPRTLLIVSHDRDFLNSVCTAILHVHDGGLKLFRGDFDTFERTRAEQLALEEAQRRRVEAERKHMQAFVDRFRYKASKARQAQSRIKRLEKLPPSTPLNAERRWSLSLPSAEDMRSPLIRMEDLSVGYGDDPPVLQRLTLNIDADDRIALLGRNGNGKSTFAKLLAGRLKPRDGLLERPGKMRVGYFAQHQIEDLRPDETALAHLARLLEKAGESQVRAQLGAFGLEGDKAVTPVSGLSGGEKARLALALASHAAPHVLILDEPTNHLDMDARDALVRALNDWQGALILISHDSRFVDLTADRLWLVADGGVTPFEGSLEDYRASLGGRVERPARAPAGEPAPRRNDKKARAEQRAQLAPLRQRLSRLEKHVASLAAARDEIDAALARPETYGDPAALARLNSERTKTVAELDEVEARWLAAAEELEALAD